MRVLFVENHEVFARTVTELFLAAHEVEVIGSIATARARLGAVAFDALLVDFDLDDGKGPALIAGARAGGFRGRIIAVSAHEEGNRRLVAAGADAVCAKRDFADIGAVLQVL